MGLLQRAQGQAEKADGAPAPARRGFLDRAESLLAADRIELVCAERLQRISSGPGSVYTAMTVLKAYFPGIAELLLRKCGDSYELADTLGISESSCGDSSIGLDLGPVPEAGYYQFPADRLRIGSIPENADAYAFPIPDTPGDLIVFIDKKADVAALASIRRIVDKHRLKFGAAEGTKEKDAAMKIPAAETVRAVASEGIKTLGEAQMLIFSAGAASKELESTVAKANAKIGNAGRAFSLPGLLVVFLKASLDRELYAHQLMKVLDGNSGGLSLVGQGSAVDEEEALAIIGSRTLE